MHQQRGRKQHDQEVRGQLEQAVRSMTPLYDLQTTIVLPGSVRQTRAVTTPTHGGGDPLEKILKSQIG